MNEQELFLAALEIDDPAARQAHLQAACADHPELLARVQSLLTSHESQSQFLNTPVVDQMVDEPVNEADATLLFQNGSTQDDEFESADFKPDERDAMTENLDHMSDEIALGYLEPSSREDSLGRLGHYEILEVIGSGAFGTVLKAFDEKLHRVVAIKVLSPQMAATSPARKRFLREARSSAAVRHENVVSIYAVEDEPIPYLVMEYIPGQTLQQRLDGNGPLDLVSVLRMGKQIADGLAAAHAQGLIHRDIKPGNILLETSIQDHVKITDFGLARAADDASMTQSGMIAGTPLYMAPEQAQGQKLDQRADLFSLGSVLYQMLSGRPPFRAPNTVAVLKRVVEDTPRPIQEIIPEVPDWMCELIGHLHAKNPDERYSSARKVSDLLAQCLADVQQGRQPQISAPQMAETVLRPALTRKPDTTQRSWMSLGRAAAFTLALCALLTITEATEVTSISRLLIRILTPGHGTLVVEVDDPTATVTVDGEEIVFTADGLKELRLKPGPHGVQVSGSGGKTHRELIHVMRDGRTAIVVSQEGVRTVSDGPDYPRLSPFEAVRWEELTPQVKIDGAWSELISINDIPVAELIRFATDRYDSKWQKRLDEDLVQVLTEMGKRPGRSVDLVLADLTDGDHRTLTDVAMTESNRWAIWTARQKRLDDGVESEGSDATTIGQSQSPAEAPPLAKAPFNEEQAKQHQKAWADYLGVPIEKEISLGQDRDGNDVTLTMVLIPPGEFMIGATDDEQVKWLNEAKAEHPNAKPDMFATIGMEDQRFVRITKPFWLSKLEFKTGQFRRFVESTGYKTDAETNGKGAVRPAPGKVFERLPELHWGNWGKISVDAGPVVNVSWNDAAKCCEWLSSQHPGMAFSLPTEAQWEFACRAGTRSSLYDCETSEELREYAQFGDEVHFIQRGGQLRPNAFGLYDMLGNVTEWCSNWLAGYAASPTDDPAGPEVPGKYEMRAIRGGSFMHRIWQVRSSKRDFYVPDNCFFDRGFRVAAAIPGDVIHKESLIKTAATEHAADTKRFQWPTDAPPPAIAPFGAAQAKKHQEAWAKYLQIEVEYTNSLGMKFVLIPPGEFTMGSTTAEIEAALKDVSPDDKHWQECIKSEAPQHKVILTEPIYLGVNEVTQSEYEKVMGVNPSHFAPMGMGKEAVAGMQTTEHPVEMVSWNDAAEFCAKLSQQEKLKPFYFRAGETITPLNGTGYRLPSEAEWEFSCRAGTATKYWIGDSDEDLVRAGWFAAKSGNRTHAAGELNANPFGLSDIHGNVWEWVQDDWDATWYGQFQEQPAIDPKNPFSAGSPRVLRGGEAFFYASACRSSFRDAWNPTRRSHGIGFRVSLSVDAVKALIER